MKRADGRAWDELRPVKITPGFLSFAEGSALIEVGQTRVLCAVSAEERVPAFLREGAGGGGWITAEYAMMPRSTVTRTTRDSSPGRVSGRNQEIQRIIGRSLRAVANLSALGERTLIVDCDVIQADGGTRTAAITGAYVALYQAMQKLADMGILSSIIPLKSAVAATSVGIVHSYKMLDLCYDEDFSAEVDFNVVMTSRGEFVEVQGTAEGKPFSKETIDALLALAGKGIKQLFEVQQAAIESLRPH
jgi:ribonuclease PH